MLNINETQNGVNVLNQLTEMTTKKPCKTCKNNTLNKSHWVIIFFSVYILITSVYGTIKLITNFF